MHPLVRGIAIAGGLSQVSYTGVINFAIDGAKTACIEPGWRRENGSCESVTPHTRHDPQSGENFHSFKEEQTFIAPWYIHTKTVRPHSALGYRPVASATIVPSDRRPVIHWQSTRTIQSGHAFQALALASGGATRIE